MEDAADVNPHDPVEILLRVIHGGLVHPHGRVVDQDVDPAPPVEGRLCHPAARL